MSVKWVDEEVLIGRCYQASSLELRFLEATVEVILLDLFVLSIFPILLLRPGNGVLVPTRIMLLLPQTGHFNDL